MTDLTPFGKWMALAPDLERVAAKAYETDCIVCPSKENVFRAFTYFAPEDTRVVILGQDPYHSIGVVPTGSGVSPMFRTVHKACGLSFGYNPEWTDPADSSLGNIIDEVLDSCGGHVNEFDRSLNSWAKQGVLLLNTRLTVEAGKPMSHAGIGWEGPIEHLLTELCTMPGPRVFMLWGAEARKSFPCLVRPSWDDKLVLETSHPCKFSAHRGFNGCQHFTKANDWLAKHGQEKIKWI